MLTLISDDTHHSKKYIFTMDVTPLRGFLNSTFGCLKNWHPG